MTIGQHEATFAGRTIVAYDPAAGITDPTGSAYRIALDYGTWEEGTRAVDLVAKLVEDPNASRLEALVFGAWDFESSGSSAALVEALCASRARLAGLRAVFLGDITYDEQEISWIQQCDVAPILAAYPALEHFRVRGGSGLALSRPDHANLRALVLEAGGLPASVVRAVASARLPSLEKLELWLGAMNYGGDATVGDVMPILAGRHLPKLEHLGLRNAECTDDIARAVVAAPIAARLRTLDLSMGTLSDAGADALLAGAAALSHLRALDLHHNYLSPAAARRLSQRFGAIVDTSGAREDEDDGEEGSRYVAVSE